MLPNARKALDHEWDKLENVKKAWNKYEVFEKADIIHKSQQTGKRVYFGELMELCHLKHSEQSEEYKRPEIHGLQRTCSIQGGQSQRRIRILRSLH